ncbi:MAG: class I SAM-dependent methyltransferase [Anaerolineae bacterium]|nr:class I SAM-dependent methyltransferase [Anaerolineae bacterium]
MSYQKSVSRIAHHVSSITYHDSAQPVDVARLPGVPEPGEAMVALLTAARYVGEGRVFIAGPGLAAVALWAARAGAEVVVWTDNIAEAASLAMTFARHQLPLKMHYGAMDATGFAFESLCDLQATVANSPHHCFLQAGFDDLEPGTCDLALLHLPRGKSLQVEVFSLAAAMLRPGGRLAFVGAKNEGIKSAVKLAQQVFGHAGIVVRKGGYHAGLAQRPVAERASARTFALPEVSFVTRAIMVADVPTQLVSCHGTFAADRLDDGAEALIAGMTISPGANVLDIGCGTGLVGLAALRRGAGVTSLDVSARAVTSTRRTLAANGYPDVPVLLSCGASAITMDCSFDGVVTNPPFHKGHGVDFEVARLFVADAARVLKWGGTLYLVANAFLPYGPWLKAHFSRVTLAWENTRFRVWKGEK